MSDEHKKLPARPTYERRRPNLNVVRTSKMRKTTALFADGLSPSFMLEYVSFTDMPVDDQIDYVQTLWDLIAAQPERVPVPDWHGKILDERLEDYARHPNEGKSWEAFRAELDIETKPR